MCDAGSGALASDSGTTQAIVNDVAKDGKVDGHYTSAQLKAALNSPLLKQYGGQGAVESVLTKPTNLQAQDRLQARERPRPRRRRRRRGEHNLPFTGADVFLFVAVGGGLLAAGLVLRRFGRRDDEASA